MGETHSLQLRRLRRDSGEGGLLLVEALHIGGLDAINRILLLISNTWHELKGDKIRGISQRGRKCGDGDGARREIVGWLNVEWITVHNRYAGSLLGTGCTISRRNRQWDLHF